MKTFPIPLLFIVLCTPVMAKDNIYTQSIETKASRETVWKCITTPEIVSKYYLAPLRTIEGHEGGRIEYGTPDRVMISGKILVWTANEVLRHTFAFGPGISPSTESEPASTVTYAIEKTGQGSTITISHSGFPPGGQTFQDISQGWPHILQSLSEYLSAAGE
ncbi:MAG: SRPBCC domain-containing protein [Verrucomicrobiales bacterium]|nr:SRPBCC domain-containing protein [Verrucomicrobiales bacterium]